MARVKMAKQMQGAHFTGPWTPYATNISVTHPFVHDQKSSYAQGMSGMCCVQHSHRLICAGATLLDLPEEILQTIAKHFDADEWARGPSMTCPRLYKMPLTRLALRQVGSAPFLADPAATRAANAITDHP